jgi:N-methylhydantoinase A/oxoprolinase/acetone carboxylase beta subunit/N-methylhydantoinase B/oxoprolinase/acetone carboxylase alpha subunit
VTLHVGIDTGGTFTDLVAFDEETGAVVTGKSPSTPDDPAQAIFAAFEAAGVDPAATRTIALGTTVGTNALLQRAGADVLFVTTAGFRDVPIIQRVDKKDPYDLQWEKPRPFVERDRCLEVDERVAADGSTIRPLSAADVERLAGEIARHADGREAAVAVSLLFSYANPEHESQLAAALRARFPGLHLSVSHSVAPTWREYERANTTIVDAYLKPVVARLVRRFEEGLGERGFGGSLVIVKSNGGQVESSAAVERPAELLLSGLAGGIVAGRYYGELAGERDVITLDMGGTSADVGMVRDGTVDYVSEYELEFGLPIALPAIDLRTVGAGGGSIAWVDQGGLLRVGPRSAGAVPGPICYGLGGEEVTVTDANLALGRLDPAFFLGGRMKLDPEAALGAVEALGRRLGIGTDEAAQAVIELTTERMANAIREASIEKGADVRDFHLVAFGGAGPLHACDIADALGMKGVVVPPHPGLASAFGTLVADRRVDRRWTQYFRSDSVDLAAAGARLDAMEAEAATALAREGFRGTPAVARSISMRYAGQNYETDVPLPSGELDAAALERLLAAFHERHESTFGYSFPDEVVELIHFNVTALGASAAPRPPEIASGPPPAPEAHREVFFAAFGRVQTPIYRRAHLPAGWELAGPAVIEEDDSTTLLPPGARLAVGAGGILRIDRPAATEGAGRRRAIDSVTMSIVNDHLFNIAQEMGTQMMRTSYSPIFSEARDFSCALFNARGEMIAQGSFCPAHLGAIAHTVEFILDEVEPETLEPGDVLLHNDPFRGGCHMPEHTLLAPVFHAGRLVAFGAVIGHMAEIGAVTVGSFASTATEVYQEGLRLPPVRLMRRGKRIEDVWKIILANHRTPRHTWGDLHAMIGALRVAEERLADLFTKYGVDFVLEVSDALIDYSERLARAALTAIPAGEYRFEDAMEDDGLGGGPHRIRVRVVLDAGRLLVDYTGSDPQARGPVNATYGVATSATYNALFQLCGPGIPRNAGAHRATKTVAPPGTIVNVAFPGPSVGGNTETQPKLVGMILGALAPALPERVMAAEGVTCCNFLFGGIHPATDDYYAHYHLEASGWGGRFTTDGNSAQNHIHGNCRNTPVEVFETRFPFLVERYELIPDSGGAGRRRGGLATRRVMTVTAPELTASAIMDRVKAGAWGLFGGDAGRPAAILVRRAGDAEFRSPVEAFGASSPSKFANVVLRLGDAVLIDSAGGGGYESAREREPALVLADVRAGLVSTDAARERYGVEIEEEDGLPVLAGPRHG